MPDDIEEALDDWADYDSIQMFPGCDCGHDTFEHKYAWHDQRDFDGCGLCDCPVEWEHE